MTPNELDTPEGWLRFRLLHTQCARPWGAKARGLLSNWTLGTAAVYVPLMVGNLDKIQIYLHKPWIGPVFWLAILSAVVGIGI
jgi:hypothetical protein